MAGKAKLTATHPHLGVQQIEFDIAAAPRSLCKPPGQPASGRKIVNGTCIKARMVVPASGDHPRGACGLVALAGWQGSRTRCRRTILAIPISSTPTRTCRCRTSPTAWRGRSGRNRCAADFGLSRALAHAGEDTAPSAGIWQDRGAGLHHRECADRNVARFLSRRQSLPAARWAGEASRSSESAWALAKRTA